MSVLFVTPVTPARTGDGLAMRAGIALRALATLGPVTLAVVLDPGRPPPAEDDPFLGVLAEHVLAYEPGPPGPADITSWMAGAGNRARLARLDPVARSTAAASPRAVAELADRVRRSAGTEQFDVVYALRLRALPWAEPFLGHGQSMVDLDDDEVATTRMLGNTAEADALGRLADELLPLVGTVAVASPDDVAVVRRHGNPNVVCVPNAIDFTDLDPPHVSEPQDRRGRTARLLFVGNLTYRPNIDAAEWLVREVLPILVTLVDRPVELDVVGRAGVLPPGLRESPGVRFHGEVPDVGPFYVKADVAVVPVLSGGGTRIKVLEAAGHGVPIVATTLGAAGLGLIDGEHLLLADTPPEFADACARTISQGEDATRRAEAARRHVEAHFAADAVVELLAACLAGEPGRIERR